MMDYDRTRKYYLDTWTTTDYDGPREPQETWTKDNDEQRETLIKPEKKDNGYVSGARLILVIIAISVVYFLNMLDTTVLATVSLYCFQLSNESRQLKS